MSGLNVHASSGADCLPYDGAEIPDILLAYVAGAIDADGHITVTRSLRTGGKRYAHKPTYFHGRIGFTSTETVVPQLLKRTFGGSVTTHVPKNQKHKPVHIWTVGTAQARRIAGLLLPHLRLKARQAMAVIELCDLTSLQHAEQKLTQKPPYRITADQLAARELIWKTVLALNQPRNRRVHLAEELPPSVGLVEARA